MVRRRFTSNKIDVGSISLERKIIGILLGVFATILLYSFLNIFREIFRIFENEFLYPNGALIFTKEERFHYNFLCAGISVILGNSVFVLYCISRPQKVFRKHSIKQKRIINDHIFLNVNFIYWATKVLFSVGITFSMIIEANFLSEYYWIFILLLFVLYLEGWKALSQMQFKQKTIIRLGHFLILFVCAFGLSQLNAVDYHRIDKSLVEQNPFIDLPITKYRDGRDFQYYDVRFLKLFMVENEAYVIIDRKKRIKLNDLNKYLKEDSRHSFYNKRIHKIAYVMASAQLPMQVVLEFEQTLYLNNYTRVKYLSKHFNNDEIDRFEVTGFTVKIILPFCNNDLDDIKPPLPFVAPSYDLENKRIVNVQISSNFVVDCIEITTVKELKEILQIKIHKDAIVQFEFSKDLVFQKYILALSTYKQAVEELRNSKRNSFLKCDDIFNKQREKCNEQEKLLSEKYPFSFIRKISN